jgi:uncharacterized protein (TIGR02466 family)
MPPSQSSDGTPQFSQLWPTQFMSLRLPGNETANPVLVDFVLAQNIQNDDMTVDYTADNIFVTEHPALIWLRQCCDRAVLDYAREAGISYDLEWVLQGWANVNMKGDYHNLHNHPHSWLSGTYYISVPDQSDADLFRSDLNPASISFFDPRPQANMNAIRNDGQVDPEHRLLPSAGDLFLWPAFLHHLVHPNMAESPRISISFNVVLKWKNDYIPR